jgi:hypothetical protein
VINISANINKKQMSTPNRNGPPEIREQKTHIAMSRQKSERKNHISQYRDGNPRAKLQIATACRKSESKNYISQRPAGNPRAKTTYRNIATEI